MKLADFFETSGGRRRIFWRMAGAALAAVCVAFSADANERGSVDRAAGVVNARPPQLIFVDPLVTDLDGLRNALPRNADVYVLSANGDPFAEMAGAVSRLSGLSAIHIISHGRSGGVQFGPRFFGAKELELEAVALRRLGASLAADGDILLYGCDSAIGGAGLSFLTKLSVLTGADVSGSSNMTGAASLGGDWALEESVGLVEVSALSPTAWNGLLAYSTATLDWTTAASLVKGTTANFTYNGSATALQFLIAGSGSIVNDYTASFTGGTNDQTTLMQPGSTSTATGQTVTMTFNAAGFPAGVETVTFDLRNIDASAGGWDDRLLVQAYDVNNVLLTGINITATPRSAVGQTYSITTLANGVQLDGNIDGAGGDNHPQDSVALSITSSTGANIGRVTVLYTSGTAGTTTGIVGISDIGMRYNLPPVLDLDSSGAGTGFTNTYVANSAGINFADVDSSVTDGNDANIASATITLTNAFANDELFVSGSLPAGIVASAYNPATGVITLTGSATKASYETAIEALRFRSTIANPPLTARSLTVVVNDGINASNIAVATISISPISTLQVTKISNGGVGPFSFTGTNGWSAQTITTLVSNTGVTGSAQALTAAGTVTDVTETIPIGYTLASATCSGKGAGGGETLSFPTATTARVRLDALATASGSNIRCTFTNTKMPTLTLAKTVVNDNGGAALDTAFTLQAAGAVTISGVEGNSSVTGAALPVGSYVLSESSLAGYSAGAWSCSAGTLTGSTINLAAGQDATCTVTNDDQPATLTLLKTVTNDNGGTAVDTDFTLTASGPLTVSGIEGAPSVTAAAVSAGTYLLTESGAAAAAYTAGSWSCTAGVLTGNSLALANGQSASCTVTNNDRPRLTLLKTVINNSGGAASDTAFTLTATGPVTVSGVEGSAAVTNANVSSGTYALTESTLSGYAGGAWSCSGGTLTGSSLTLAQNENATCTVTNDDQPATLTLSKIIVNTGGGTAGLASFPLAAAGPTNIAGVSGDASVTGVAVNAGVYSLSEVANSNYTAGAWSCSGGTLTGSSLTLALGQTAVCSITNTFVPMPGLSIKKTADTAGPLVAGQTVNYSYLVTNTGNVTISGVNVAETAFNGSGAAPSPVSAGLTMIAPGQSILFTASYIVTQQDVDTLQ